MAVVKNMVKAGKVASLGVERNSISILFSDIRGFTTICEAMQLAQLLELLSHVTRLALALPAHSLRTGDRRER